MSSTGGIVKEFAHHPMAGSKTETFGTFAGETKMDAWLFKHSHFLRTHFKHEEHLQGESSHLSQESFQSLGQRGSVDTGATPEYIMPGEEHDNGNVEEDAKWHQKTNRRSSLQKAGRWVFWYNGNK